MSAGAAAAGAAHVLVDEPRDLADELARLLRRHRLGQRRRRARRARRAARRGARRAPARAARARGRASAACASRAASATASLAAIIRCSISGCDSVCSLGDEAGHVALAREVELRLDGLDRERAARGPRAPSSAAATPRARRERLRPRLLGALGAGEDPVHLRVVEPRVRADQRAVEGGAHDVGAVEVELDGDREAVLVRARASRRRWRAPRAASARPCPARRRWSRAGRPRGRPPSRAARARRRRRCGPRRASTPPSSRSALIASSKSRAVGGSIVNVGRSRRSLRGTSRAARSAAAARLALDERVEAPAQPAVEHQRLEHVARDVRAAEPARARGRARRAGRSARPARGRPGAGLLARLRAVDVRSAARARRTARR